MRLIDKIFGVPQIVKDLQTQIAGFQNQQLVSSYINYNTAIYPKWGIFKDLEAYRVYDDVYSIVTLLAQTAAMVNVIPYKVVNDAALKQMTRTSGLQRKYFQLKALEDLPDTDMVFQSMDNPSTHLSKTEYAELWALYMLLSGEAFEYKVTIEFGPEKGKTEFHLLRPDCMTLIISEGFPQKVIGYKYLFAGGEISFTPDEVTHFLYVDPVYSNGQEWRGCSPLQALTKTLTRIDSARDVSVAQLQNGGVPGIVYQKDYDESITSLGSRKENFNRFLREKENKGAPYFAGGEMGYIQIGAVLADLSVEELSKIDFKKICNAYKVSDTLFNNSDASTESNVQIMTKRLYTNSVLPLVNKFADGRQKGFINKLKTGIKYKLEVDISAIPELQDDMNKQADALSKMWWVTPNEKREIQKFDKSEDTNMDNFYIPSGFQLLEDIGAIPDLPNTGDYENA